MALATAECGKRGFQIPLIYNGLQPSKMPAPLCASRSSPRNCIFQQAASALIFLFALGLAPANAEEASFETGGHLKARLLGEWFPDDSLFAQFGAATALDIGSDLRFSVAAGKSAWGFAADYQLIAAYGDQVEVSRALPDQVNFFAGGLQNDDHRLFNLTSVIEDDGKFAALQRLDRLWIGYTGDSTVLRFGRQAISWGNGLIFSPMDVVNPFDPTAVDTEYKTGDDMLYGQYLRENGHDIQAAMVFRRDPASGNPDNDQGTAAAKYHGIAGAAEYDFLLARHYGDTIIALGGNRNIGGSVWRGDVVITNTRDETKIQLVTNLSYSWSWGGKNLSGVVEYYFNEFGQKGGRYDVPSLAQNPELLRRLSRGETFTLGRNYLAGGLTIELTPLWTLTPNLFSNIDDGSALLQIITNNSLSQNVTFTGAVNVPLGPSGTEFGGIEAEMAGVYLATDCYLFAQIAWYF
jgi:hypothetical protein